MVVTDMEGGSESVGTARCAVTVAAAGGAIVGSAIFEQGCRAQVNTQGRVVRHGHEARQTVMEKTERLETVAFHKRIHSRMPEMAQRARECCRGGRTDEL